MANSMQPWFLVALVHGAVLPGEFDSQMAIMVTEQLCSRRFETAFKAIANLTLEHDQMLHVSTKNGRLPKRCTDLLSAPGHSADELLRDKRVVAANAPTETIWIRDFGPFVTVTEDGKYQVEGPHYPRGANTRKLDTQSPKFFSNWLCDTNKDHCGAFSEQFKNFLLEGGNVLPNGQGLCLVSEAVLCQAGKVQFCRQNEAEYATKPPYGKDSSWMKKFFASHFGCTDLRILQGHYGDESLNHVDMFFTFASAQDLLFGTSDESDPRNQAVDVVNRHRLSDLINSGALKIHEVPMPTQCRNAKSTPSSCKDQETRILRTFLNGVFFAHPNRKLRTYLMPVYDVGTTKYRSQETTASRAFEKLGWTVKKVNGDSLITQNGNFHCVTRNVPLLQASNTGGSGGPLISSTPECNDTKESCGYWEGLGYCTHQRYGDFMQSYCAKSCGTCSTAGKIVRAGALEIPPVPASTDTASSLSIAKTLLLGVSMWVAVFNP
jgi:agmatine/peptidylarginine deiminase